MKLGLWLEVWDLGDGDEIVDLLATILEVEAGVTKGRGEVDDGLANLVDLFLGRYLLALSARRQGLGDGGGGS